MCYFVKYNEISIAKINQISCILFSDVLQIAQQDTKSKSILLYQHTMESMSISIKGDF